MSLCVLCVSAAKKAAEPYKPPAVAAAATTTATKDPAKLVKDPAAAAAAAFNFKVEVPKVCVCVYGTASCPVCTATIAQGEPRHSTPRSIPVLAYLRVYVCERVYVCMCARVF